MMNDTTDVSHWLEALGKTHAELVANGLNPELRPLKIFPGDDEFYLEPAAGVSYEFNTDSKILKAIIVNIVKRVEEEPEFKSTLSPPYACHTQSVVRDRWGEPLRFKGAMWLPLPIGQTGGWDLYNLASQDYDQLELIYKYTVDLRVSGIVLRIKEDEN